MFHVACGHRLEENVGGREDLAILRGRWDWRKTEKNENGSLSPSTDGEGAARVSVTLAASRVGRTTFRHSSHDLRRRVADNRHRKRKEFVLLPCYRALGHQCFPLAGEIPGEVSFVVTAPVQEAATQRAHRQAHRTKESRSPSTTAWIYRILHRKP